MSCRFRIYLIASRNFAVWSKFKILYLFSVLRKKSILLVLFVVVIFLADLILHNLLQSGLHKYYDLNESNKIALIGHSHLMLGVNKSTLEEQLGQKVSKYTIKGVNVADRRLMIDYLLKKNPNTEVLIYGVDAWMFTGEGLSTNSYNHFLPFMDDAVVQNEIMSIAPPEEFWQKRFIKTSRYSESSVNSALRGHLGNWSNYKIGSVDTVQLKKIVLQGSYRKINSEPENRKIFEETISLLMKKNLKVILVYVPTISYYNQAEPEKFQKELVYFQRIADSHKNIEYFEYLENWESQFSFFFDPIHLNPEGQAAFTSSFSQDLKYLLK